MRAEIVEKISRFAQGKPIKTKELKIAEDEQSSLAIIFDESEQIYLGRKGKDEYFPLLKDQFILQDLPQITVDSGAVKFVCNGANIMRPGIVKVDGNFPASSLVVVKEEKYGKQIAVGKSLLSNSEIQALNKGPVIENLHYVGDKYWDLLKQLQT